MIKNIKQNESEKIEDKTLKRNKFSKIKFLFGFVTMLLLLVGSAATTYHMTPIILASLVPYQPIIIKARPVVSNALPIEEILEEQTTEELVLEEVSVDEIAPPSEPQTEIQESVVQESASALPSQITEKEPPSTQNDSTTESLIISLPKRTPPPYSVLKAIELKESFKNGGECRPLLEELIALPDKTQSIDYALTELLQACLERPISGQMQTAFKQAKRRAILRIFQNENPVYLSYLKALPYLIADIRKKNPNGETPMDILAQIQNAVEADHPQMTLDLITKLPQNVQATLNDVTQHAILESKIYHTINQLIKTLFEGEE